MLRKKVPITAEQWLEKVKVGPFPPLLRVSGDLAEINLMPGAITYVSRRELDGLVVGWS